MADTKITDLTSASASTGDELVVSTTALTDRKVTAESVANLARVITLSSGTATVTPLRFTPGTLNTTSTQGAIEYDGTCFYATAVTSGRQIITADQVITQTTAFTGSTALTVQKLFDASTGLNGAVTVGPSMTYLFESAFHITSKSTTSNTHTFQLGGTAAVDRTAWTAFTVNIAATSVPTAPLMTRAAVTANIINAATTVAQMSAFIQGKVTIGTSGTLIPSITRSAGTVAMINAADSYFRIWPIGSTSVTRVGHWS